MAVDEPLDYRVKNGRAYVTRNQPSRENAVGRAMWDALMASYARAKANEDTRSVGLQNAGEDSSIRHQVPPSSVSV